ncbi:MAG: glycosyltransferase, partial [Rhodothermales bacterium]
PGGRFDAIMVFCPLMGAVAYAAILKRLKRVPLWLNVQDLPAEAALSGGISGGAAARGMLRVEDALFNKADVWSTISPAMVDSLSGKRRRNQPILYIPNWLHKTLAEAISSLPVKKEGPPSIPPNLLYSGNIGTKQNLLAFCRVLRDSRADFRFVIQGEGSEARALREWLAAAADPRFEMRGLSDEQNLARALHETDYFVITERGDSGGSFIPSKLIPSLAAGTPVLALCDASSPLGREMNEQELGPQFEWKDAPRAADLLGGVDPGMYSGWRRHVLERASFYDRERVLDVYAGELRKVMRGTLAA